MRVVMYWHNGRSLGHTAESAKVAHGLADSGQEFHLSGLTGAYRGLDLLPSAMDVVKLPAFTNYDNVAGWATRGRAAMAAGPLFRMRAEMAEVFLRHYEPDVLLVNHLPKGAENELAPALTSTRGNGGRRILTLRGVLFDADKTNREYFSEEGARWIDQHFDAIHVHTHPDVFRLEDHYAVPGYLKDRIRYTGYLVDEFRLSKEAARARLGVAHGERLIVAGMGGGQGAMPLWNALIDALTKQDTEFDRVRLVTGPYLEAGDAEALRERAASLPWLEITSYEPAMMVWMAAADLFVGAAGANMLSEILAVGCNSVVIPRQVRESEQRIHAQLLADRGLVRMCDLPEVLSGAVAPVLAEALREPLAPESGNLLGGARRYPALLGGEEA
ncbi:glycosyltransferase family protein [Streptomyces bangladeshensis]|uniref:Glycosyl transferase family 28 C-terminal domain-containing protein n=1 Tax=Streptomyces bangladeshensis TaxID=295352 RepID=A0ABN3BDX4_9ACTN